VQWAYQVGVRMPKPRDYPSLHGPGEGGAASGLAQVCRADAEDDPVRSGTEQAQGWPGCGPAHHHQWRKGCHVSP
jgi:hypothetical protein